jgi:TamB, inner membrane protein subunit of TAM complex
MEEQPKLPSLSELPEAAATQVDALGPRVARWFRALWRRVENTVFGLVLFILALYFTLQSAWVQNWLIQKVSSHLSAELHTTVTVGRVDLHLFDRVALERVYIADQSGDTLLYAGELTAGLADNILSVLNRKLVFNEITLKNATVYLRQPEGSYDNNAQFLLDYFGGQSGGPKKPKQPFGVQIQRLKLLNVLFVQDDRAHGAQLRCLVPSLSARVNRFDAPAKIVDIESLHISGLQLEYADIPYQKLAPRAPVTPPAPVDTTQTKREKRVYHFNVHHLNLDQCDVRYDYLRRAEPKPIVAGVLNPDHIAVRGLSLQADSLKGDENLHFALRLSHFAAQERSGLTIQHAESDRMIVTDSVTQLYGMRLETTHSQLGDTILLRYNERDDDGKRLGYKSFRKFNNRVAMDLRLAEGSQIGLADLRHFDNALAENKYLKQNEGLVADIKGRIKGKVNDLTGDDVEIRIGTGFVLDASFRLDNIAKSGPERVADVKIEQLSTNITTLKGLVPGFKPPAVFERLGNVQFKGRYNLFFGTDHIVEGAIKTSIGYGKMNMDLKKAPGEEATYNGKLAMNQFDLGRWSGNKDLGLTSFQVKIKDGRGLSLSTVEAKLEGSIDTFSYKGYRYKAIIMDGQFSQSLFDGKMAIHDPSLDFVFDGTINLRDSIPKYNFGLKLDKLDLGRLRLANEDLVVSGIIDTVQLTGRNLEELFGFARLRNFKIVQEMETQTIAHRIDSVRFDSRITNGTMRRFSIQSDIMNAAVEGFFNFDRSPRNLLRILSRNHPELALKLGLPPDDSVAVKDIYRFGLFINNTHDLTKLVDKQLDTLRNISIGGSVNGPVGQTEAHIKVPYLRYGSVQLRDIRANWLGKRDMANFNVKLPQTRLSSRITMMATTFTGIALRDQIQFSLNSKDTVSLVQGVDFNGVLTFPDSVAQIKFNTSKFDLFNQSWGLGETNYIRFGQGRIETNAFELFNDEDQRIALTSINEGKGLNLSFTNFDLDFLNKIVPARGIKYRASLETFEVDIQDVFAVKNTKVYIATDTVFLNNTPYGRIDGSFDWPSLDEPLEWGISAHDDSLNLSFKGAWQVAGKETRPTTNGMGDLQPGGLNSQITGYNFPMNIIQQFVPGISKVDGRFDINSTFGGKIAGKNTAVGLNGLAQIKQGEFQIDYLKSMYYVKDQPVRLTNYLIRVDSGLVRDRAGHLAMVNGGLTHDFFRKWQIDCKVWSLGNDFMVLKTTKADNPLYYGTGVGKFSAQFSGTFSRTDIRVDAVAYRGSRLFIPLTDDAEIKDVSFIKYKPKPDASGKVAVTDPKIKQGPRRFSVSDIKGLNFEMNLTLTDQAMIEMIFDEAAGDILSGWGVGDIQLIINRDGDFKMYGRYEVKRGEYLFTLLNFVNKPFAVASGGTIHWYGDPYGAQINLDAIYDESTPIYNLLRDELNTTANETLTREATRPSTARVVMHMTKDLFKPEIAFDFEFPNLSPQLKSYADNKLRLLKQDPNEVSRQVFGLIVFGTFLPPDEFAPQSVGVAFSTITQLVSTQLSNYLTGLASEWFGGTVSSINFDLAYNQYDNIGSISNLGTGREVQLRMSSGFVDDRITINIGTQFGSQSYLQAQNSNTFSEDIVVEIQPLENRQWRVEAYQRGEPDLVTGGGGYRFRYGLGLSFSKDFNNFDDLRRGVGDFFKKKG